MSVTQRHFDALKRLLSGHNLYLRDGDVEFDADGNEYATWELEGYDHLCMEIQRALLNLEDVQTVDISLYKHNFRYTGPVLASVAIALSDLKVEYKSSASDFLTALMEANALYWDRTMKDWAGGGPKT